MKLQKKNIIRKKREFQEVYDRGRSYSGNLLVIYVMKSEKDELKAGFAAGKKLGCAVVRNRIKRIMRESFRLRQKNIKKGFNILFIARKNAIYKKQPEMEAAFVSLARRARIFIEDAQKNFPFSD